MDGTASTRSFGLKPVRITAPARRDLQRVLAYTESHFGDVAADRYHGLILRGLIRIAQDGEDPATRRMGEEGSRYLGLHLKAIRSDDPERVRKPRHIIVFIRRENRVDILRILHDRMDLPRHLS